MARQARKKAESGIYHVMLRGINKQDIFFDEGDFTLMQRTLADARFGKRMLPDDEFFGIELCQIYAYCILHNHVHILLREKAWNVSQIMQRIENMFVATYNLRYERDGHLFKGRFRSEPVDDAEYFFRLIRYIHRNPVKAMEAVSPEDYPYSSWREYLMPETVRIPVCYKEPVMTRFPLSDLKDWVNMDIDDKCMDMESERRACSDSDAAEILLELSNCDNIEDFKQLSPDLQLSFINNLIQHGVSIRQASRLSTLSFSKIQRSLKVNHGVRPHDSCTEQLD